MTQKKNTQKRIDNPEFLRQLAQTYLQEYLEQEMARFLGALPYERTETRKGYRNGYKPRQLNTRVGKLFLSVPQTRDGSFSTELFERYQRTERALISPDFFYRERWSSRGWPLEESRRSPRLFVAWISPME